MGENSSTRHVFPCVQLTAVSLASCSAGAGYVWPLTKVCLTFSLVITVSSLLMSPRKGRTADIRWSDTPSERVWKPKPNYLRTRDHASFLGHCCIFPCRGWAVIWPAVVVSPGHPGSGGPVGCHGNDCASLSEVLEHSL